ncbi:MAG TPA: hypothetical protein DER40_11835 [Geobacter sp.]|nr:hypothetical protein [Geobacter sp.]
MRCTKDDMRGMIGSIAKIVAIIVASILTAGALAPLAQGLAVAMASTSIVTPAAAMAISSAIITSAVTSIMNLGIDAATVGIDGQAWAIQSSISLVSAGVMAYLGGAVTDGFKTFMRPDGAMVTTQTVTQTLPAAGYDAGVEAAVGGLQGNVQQGSLSLVSSTAGGQTLSTIGTYVGEPLIKTSDGIWQQIKNMGTSLSNNLLGSSTQSVQIFTDRLNHTITTITSTLTTSPTALAQSLYYAQQIGAVVQPAINAGMMASYQTKKCCNPDSIAASCEASEIEEWSLVEKGNCHRVGTYCDTKFLGMCMAHKETSCCFASKLARIIHEQGRPQLQAFGEGGGWGSPESPRCRGFTPDEFQMVDFGQLNLDEYVADLTAQIQQVGPGFQNYMDSVSADASNRANTLVPAGE